MLLKGQYHEKIRSFLCQWGAVVGSNYEPPSFFKHLKLLNIIEILSYDLLQPHMVKKREFSRDTVPLSTVLQELFKDQMQAPMAAYEIIT